MYINFVASIGVYLAVFVFSVSDNSTITRSILIVAQRTFAALVQSLSGVVLIVKSIFTNETSPELIRYMVDHLYDIITFVFDLIRPSGVITTGNPDEAPVNDYWELDFKLKANRQAIGAQIQRVLLTIRDIIAFGTVPNLPTSLDQLPMNIELPSDKDAQGKPPSPTYIATPKGGAASAAWDEKWIYINGIGNERVWFESACHKISEAFQRQVTGVYNRSDGILWDMIQCFGEHSAVSEADNSLIQRTASSIAAEQRLEYEIRGALWPTSPGVPPPKKLVLICHSQGCLLTRLALQALVTENPEGSQRRNEMREKLRVFPFANPSMDWRVKDNDKTTQFLGNYAHITEHYAHEVDFVAMLGVISHMKNPRDPKAGFMQGGSSVFTSVKGPANPAVGHLFGAHYALDPEWYQNADENGEPSRLFEALGGVPIA
ncbi:uncharacterized protein B0I36DRAFT_257464 [Microdochium trichocladiopsis]|uniref:Uncharacterized protein n=1 Tax=Microdochium trichocladiopsis TaxID=1682393 RepID=A0A9P9BF83_9PEZI|nr:uncharacterized protein B0I36DRAFT_257464 [Microdochium trichocladiopsis]KAH7010665.1 hypothetical protein B0I36DRAFT_257464 [Microdochium trichocladiopsis]